MEKRNEKMGKVDSQDYGESQNTPYCTTRRYGLTFDETVQNLKIGLEKLGFDIVGEFNVQDYLSSKIEKMPKHLILLVCEKETATKLITNDIQMGILFPCNVSIKEVEHNSIVEIAIEDTDTTWASSLKLEIQDIAKNTKRTLKKVLDDIEQNHFKL
ncbi:MAG: DUF302 domain-containing protein [Flavobacteriales bacterium]